MESQAGLSKGWTHRQTAMDLLPLTPILWHQVDVPQFRSILTWTILNWQSPPRLRNSATVLGREATHTSVQLGYKYWGSYDPRPFRYNYSPEWHTELGKALLLLFCCKGYKCTARRDTQGSKVWKGPEPSPCPHGATSVWSPTQKLSKLHCSEFLSHRHDWLNH